MERYIYKSQTVGALAINRRIGYELWAVLKLVDQSLKASRVGFCQEMESSMTKDVSVIIPTYNSFSGKQGSLHLTLLSLARQDISEQIEVIIIDNGSNDKTHHYLADVAVNLFPKRCQWFICNDTGNRSLTRNLAVERSATSMIVLMDDDVVLPEQMVLRNAIEMMAGVNRGFACGARRRWMNRHWDEVLVENAILRGDIDFLQASSFLPCGISRESGYRDLQEFSFIANFGVIPRSLFELIGGFDVNLFPSRREDVDLMYRLLLNEAEYIHLYDKCECIHLTHPMVAADPHDRVKNHLRFQQRERECGYHFKVNQLFGVYEGCNGPVLEPF